MPITPAPAEQPSALRDRYRRVRAATEALAAPLSAEDCTPQSMPDASPVKWHLAHTAWFFETFLLLPHVEGAEPFDPSFALLFNSYYHGVGPQFRRAARGLLTRPGLERVRAYRGHVDRHMEALLARPELAPELRALVALGLAHEEQHQELILTDLKHLLWHHPDLPAYAGRWPLARVASVPRAWVSFPGGLVGIGHAGEGFAFDNEGPRHRRWLEPFELASHPVTNADWVGFIEDGGYRRPELWLSDGWAAVEAGGWEAPLYWRAADGGWRCFTLHGDAPLDPHAPVAHVSFYEADAFARWAGARLPSEAEWETAAAACPLEGNFADSGALHPLAPRAPAAGGTLAQMFGDVWEWTRSAYEPYPGFAPAAGAVGEYNGKFMSGQQVLRGGSCATAPGHVRATYRNFFPPQARWQFSGLRLARDCGRADGPGPRSPRFIDLAHTGDSREAVAEGLMQTPARIPSGLFYDALGSRLFEAITLLDAYGLTRAEAALLEAHGAEMAAAARARLGPGFQLVDLGAGSCAKAERLLPQLQPTRYVAIDIAAGFLEESLARVQAAFPLLEMVGIAQDFAHRFALPPDLADRPTLYFYPGSSIGNFTVEEAGAFLSRLRAAVRAPSAILAGFDLVRDPAALVAAYDDPAGVTAAFNRNILLNVNLLLGADFAAEHWRHVALWREDGARIEMHLEAETAQEIRWPGGARSFAAGERILTEISTKWTAGGVAALLEGAGFGAPRLWVGPKSSFAVALA
jgi:dimethylhistidine N-methyltransferase